ncbi:MAG TPA: non-homologous end-joining DNA ligase [Candidatus Binatia bacterium]|nr:non-homologous end-joining DNA ligase [Candidatus Binatia bacterium]
MNAKVFTALPAAKLRFIEPMYARVVNKLPEGPDWQYEIKFDGYRCLAGRNERGVSLWSRKGNLFTSQFPEIARACERLTPDTLLDGEIVAIDGSGRASFNLLQNSRSRASAIQYYAFDLIFYEGKSLLGVPLEPRRELLAEALRGLGPEIPIRFSEAIEAPPADLLAAAKELGLEGVIAKRKDSCYETGKRTGSWLKFKVNRTQPFVIGGYTRGNPLDAVIVGYYQDGKLVCAGKVRNGFVPRLRQQIHEKLRDLQIDICPFANLPERKRTPWAITKEEMANCIWLKPELVAQIEFTEWTVEDQLRQAKFVGLRNDKSPSEIVREE